MENILLALGLFVVVGVVWYFIARRVARKNAQKLQPLLGVVLPQEEGKK
jgi:preprotein translocase subunit YajC